MSNAADFYERLPERLLFANKLKTISADVLGRVVTSNELSPEAIEATKRTGWLSFDETPIVLSAPVLGADEITVDTFSYADGFTQHPSGNAFYLDVHLRKQGEPFIPESDVVLTENLGIEASNNYLVHTNPDMPPSAVSFDFTELANDLDLFGLQTLVQVASDLGRAAVHELTDEECASLTTALTESLTVDHLDFGDMMQMHGMFS